MPPTESLLAAASPCKEKNYTRSLFLSIRVISPVRSYERVHAYSSDILTQKENFLDLLASELVLQWKVVHSAVH